MTAPRLFSLRRRSLASLLTGSAIGAALCVFSGSALAQGFQGASTVVSGGAAVITAPDYTSVEIVAPETVIEWTPFDVVGTGTIDFLPNGATAEFSEPGGNFGFTVLNRILPVDGGGNPVARAVAFNGTVTSLSGGAPGGNVWFYSPTGIIAGPTARFNVGGLVLTTNDIVFGPANTGGTELFGAAGEIQFRGPADSTSFVDVQASAQIAANASAFGPGYVALVAPRIAQGGQIAADGPIAYAAAEQLDLTIDAGLFDIAILVGTTDANGVVHTGTTTGPASTNIADVQRIAIVALPKNDALTMLLSGSVGYAPAASVFDEGSSIVLTSGYDSGAPSSLPANTLGDIAIDAATFRNALEGYASNAVTVSAGTGATAFEGTANFYALDAISVAAVGGNTLSGAESLNFFAGVAGSGGTIDVAAVTGGGIDVADSLSFNVGESTHLYFSPASYVDAQGGDVTIVADNGTIAAGFMSASAQAFGSAGSSLGGAGAAGSIDVSVLNGGQITAGSLDLLAVGVGGTGATTGGDGTGGTIALSDLGGLLNFGSVSADASGFGGGVGLGTAGDGFSGEMLVNIAGQAQSWTSLFLTADAGAGAPPNPALGLSGSAIGSPDAVRLSIAGPGALSIGTDFSIRANALTAIDGVAGFTGQAGGIAVEVTGGGDLTIADAMQVEASALIGGDFDLSAANSSPTQRGGTISVLADSGGSISALYLEARAEARSTFAATTPGDATGGSIEVTASNGGTIALTDSAEQTVISANGYGSPGLFASNAFGGSALLAAEDGAIDAAHDVEVTASGLVREFDSSGPPLAGNGFAATGGTAAVEIRAGTAGSGTIDAANLSVRANGDARLVFFETPPPPGGEAIQGDGGDGAGGTARVGVAAGALTTGQLLVDSIGTGGASAPTSALVAFQAGDGIGGTSQFTQAGGATTVAVLGVLADGLGGGASVPAGSGPDTAALAGTGTGGGATLTLSGGALQATTLARIIATGTGANGMDHISGGVASSGGVGTGGQALLDATAGSSATFSTPALVLNGGGVGGAGGVSAGGTAGDGGDGTGLSARIALTDGAFAFGTVDVAANGTGGDGATGGAGTGGEADLAVVDATGPTGARALADLTVEANGIAGASATGPAAAANAGAIELIAQVLDADSSIAIGGNAVLEALGTNAGAGSGLTANIAGAALNIGGTLTADVTGDIAIAATQPLLATGDATLTAGRSFTATGQVGTAGSLAIQAPMGIEAERLLSGGATLLAAPLGAVSVSTDLASTGPVTALARSFDIVSLGALTFTDLDATAGPASVTTAGDLDLAAVDATGAVTLRSTGGAIAATGAVNAGANAIVEGSAGVALPTLNSGGTTQLASANGPVDIDTLVSPGTVSVSANGVDIAGPGPLTFTTAQADTTMTIVTPGNLSFSSVSAGGALALTSSGGSLTVAGNVDGGSTALTAADDIAIGGGLTGTPLTVNSGGAFSVAGDATTGAATIVAPDGITLAGFDAAGTVQLTAANGAISASNLTATGDVTASARSIEIASSGALGFADLDATAGPLSVTTAGTLDVETADATGAVSLVSTGGGLNTFSNVAGDDVLLSAQSYVRADGDIAAAGQLAVEAGDEFRLAGTASGTSIAIRSSDIRLFSESAVGVRGATATVELINGDSLNPTFVGGGEAGVYELDLEEAQLLFADNSITIGVDVAPSAPAGYGVVVIDDLSLSFGADANIGAGGLFEISTPREVSIVGDVTLATVSADDTFLIDPTLIELDSDTGSIAMIDDGGNPLGRLSMVGDRIAIADTDTLSVLRSETDFAAINAALDQPGGAAEPLRASVIVFDVADALFIQNGGASDAYADRRGFAASSVEIVTADSSNRIAVNGQIFTADGPVGGLDTAPLVVINGAPATTGGQFDPASTINGCAIGIDCTFVPPPPPPDLPTGDLPTSNDLEQPLSTGEPAGSQFVAPLIELAGVEPLITPPLVDEPITGVGNDDLWVSTCDQGDESCEGADGQQ